MGHCFLTANADQQLATVQAHNAEAHTATQQHRFVQAGLFRPGLRARDVYLMIAAMGYFYLSNRYTLSAFLGEALEAPAALAHWQQFITEAVLRTVLVSPPALSS